MRTSSRCSRCLIAERLWISRTRDSDKLRRQLHQLGAVTYFPRKARCGIQRKVNKQFYRQRYRIENYFCRLKRWASTATRRDKLASHFLALVQFASLIDWLRSAP